MYKAGSKRKATASGTPVPEKRSPEVHVPEEVLRTMASSLSTATLALMALPSTDIAARGRVVAIMDECKRQLNDLLGIKRRGTSVLAISDLIVDVLLFVRRQDLDSLQIVSRRFSAIVDSKQLTQACLRRLNCAKIWRGGGEREFVLMMDEVGAKKKARLPTGVDDEEAATALLLKACRSSSVDSLQLYGRSPMSADFFDVLADLAPTVFLKEFRTGKRILSAGVSHVDVLRASQCH